MAVIESGSSTDLATVDTDKRLYVKTAQILTPSQVGAIRMASENDAGDITGTPQLLSPETDKDYRLRVAHELPLDDETFNYTAQNTGKHIIAATTMTTTYTTAGLVTNSLSIITTTTGSSFASWAHFPFYSSGESLNIQAEISFSSQPVSNTIVDFGVYQRPITNPFAPTDGAYFRLNSSGLVGVTNHNGTETTTSVLSFTYTINEVNKYLIVVNNNETQFWINDVLYGSIITPVGQAQPFMSTALPFVLRHVIVGGSAGGVFQATLRGYGVSLGGLLLTKTYGEINNGIYGSYQGLSGGTMGTIGTYTNSTNPAAAVPTNTTAAVGAVGLLNQAWETFSLAVNTDGILLSYLVPASTVSVAGKRLKVSGVKLSSFVQTVLVGGPISRIFCLAFGHTAVSMATAESGSTKARRIVLLPELTQHVTAAQAVNTAISKPGGCVSMFPEPIYVNPSEFVAVTVKGIGTVGTSGTIVSHIQLIYSWE